MYDKLIEKIRRVNSADTQTDTASSDPQGVKLAQFFSTGPGRNLGCQLATARELTEIIIGRKLPTVIGATTGGLGGTDGYVGQLRVVVLTAGGGLLGYPTGSTVLYVRPVTSKGSGRGFRPESPTVRQPIHTTHVRQATQSEVDALLEQIEMYDDLTDTHPLTTWFAAGDWSLKSLAKLAE